MHHCDTNRKHLVSIFSWRLRPFRELASILATLALLALSLPTFAAIAYQQSEWETQIQPQSVIRVWIPAAQSAGNLNAVIVGWADASATVLSGVY
jgi:hypothetical protein